MVWLQVLQVLHFKIAANTAMNIEPECKLIQASIHKVLIRSEVYPDCAKLCYL